MKAHEYEVQDLIPQKPPMKMIDALIHADERSARGSLFILPGNIFCENGLFGEPGMIEFIAQTAAAYTGFKHIHEGTEVTEGYIGAVKNLVIHSLPAVNTEIHSEISVENEIVGYTIVIGKVFQSDRLLAECEMRILGK